MCKTHNAFTNDNYEKKYVADLDFFRNHLGLTTRDGKPIQYKADITIDGTEMHNVKISNRASLYAPKDVVAGVDDNGHKILMAPMERINKISKGKATAVDISDVTLHKTITADSFLGFYAVHSVAKMAYEWYCYMVIPTTDTTFDWYLKLNGDAKGIGVNVYFEEQNIYTMSADGELMMTILASYAQEESRSASENQKWRIRANFEAGLM